MALELILSLHEDEKKILDDFYKVFHGTRQTLDLNLPELYRYVFEQWAWTRAVHRGLSFVMYRDEAYHYHEGDREKSWTLFLTRTAGSPAYWYSQHSKLAKLEEDNPGFPQAWSGAPDNVPHLIPNIVDQPYWKRLGDMYFFRYIRLPALARETGSARLAIQFNDPSTENLAMRTENPTMSDASTVQVTPNRSSDGGVITIQLPHDREFEIWPIVHICSVFERAAAHRGKVREALRDCGFENLYDRVEDGFARKGPVRDQKLLFIEDPVDYLEFIPWEQLQGCAAPPLYGGDESESKFVHWLPENSLKFDHHLHPNISTYRYFVETDTYLPGHTDQGMVLFFLSPLREGRIVRELRSFWVAWNDCAITQMPSTGEWMLMETVPGFEFRNIWDSRGMYDATIHFSRQVDWIRSNSAEVLRDIMGPSFDPKYEELLLNVIPLVQITAIDPIPLGHGERGIVYKGVWSRQPGMIYPAEDIHVALKVMRTPSEEGVKRFFKELDADLKALREAGTSRQVIQLFGISKTTSKQREASRPEGWTNNASPTDILPDNAFILVMEYAKFGSLTNYLGETLIGDISDWERIFEVLKDLAISVWDLHKSGIIHRDLHENNILMGMVDTPRDPDALQHPGLKISDLGESALYDNLFMGGTYGYRNSWAPEVRRGRKYSIASDVYAMGCLIAKVVMKQWEVATSKTGMGTTVAPKIILDTMKACLRSRPEHRPSAEHVYRDWERWDMEHNCKFDMAEIDLKEVFSLDDGFAEEQLKGFEDGEIPV